METVKNVLRGRSKDEEEPQNKITVQIEDWPGDSGTEETNRNKISRVVELPSEGRVASTGAAGVDAITEADVADTTGEGKTSQTEEAAPKTGAKRVVYDPALNDVKVIDVDTGMIEDSYSARSGPVAPPGGYKSGDKQKIMGEKGGTITSGIWMAKEPPRLKKPPKKNDPNYKSYVATLDQAGNSWFQWIVPYNEALNKEYKLDPDRTYIGFHPDGNVPGTEGCVGIQEEDTKNIYEWWRQHWSHTTIEVVEGRGGITKWELEKMDKTIKMKP